MWKSRSDWFVDGFWLSGPLGLFLSAMLVVGCDSSGAEQSSRYQTLTGGRWEVAEFRVDQTDLNSQLDQQYASVWFEFSGGEGEARTYKLVGTQERDTLRVEGDISLPGPGRLIMVSGFERPVTWEFTLKQPDELSTSVRFGLPEIRETGSEAFLSRLLPGQGWGESQAVRLDLFFEEEAQPNER